MIKPQIKREYKDRILPSNRTTNISKEEKINSKIRIFKGKSDVKCLKLYTQKKSKWGFIKDERKNKVEIW